MDLGATRIFGSAIHEFAQSIGKDNFLLVGEITGGRFRAFDTLEITGLDAALGIDEIPGKMEFLAKGHRNPDDYFALFRNSLLIGKDSHTWFRNKVVTLFNDHDQVSKGGDKARFCADADAAKLVLNALAPNKALTDMEGEKAQTDSSGRRCSVVNSVPTKANMSISLTILAPNIW